MLVARSSSLGVSPCDCLPACRTHAVTSLPFTLPLPVTGVSPRGSNSAQEGSSTPSRRAPACLYPG